MGLVPCCNLGTVNSVMVKTVSSIPVSATQSLILYDIPCTMSYSVSMYSLVSVVVMIVTPGIPITAHNF